MTGVQDSDFRHPSTIHGAAHVNRVIVLGQLLLRRLEDIDPETEWVREYRAPLWAACYLHDLARRHDGTCAAHGRWAVEERLAEFWPLFERYGVEEWQLPAIAEAVTWHSLPDDLPQWSPHWRLAALLKDADALDRVRIAAVGCGLNPHMLRTEAARDLIPVAEAIYDDSTRNPKLVRGPDLWPLYVAASRHATLLLPTPVTHDS